MPYVSVWVDDIELECDGYCEHSKRLEKAIAEAREALAEGRADDAMKMLGRVIGAADVKKADEREAELAKLYKEWAATPTPHPGFLDWAHKRRKATLA